MCKKIYGSLTRIVKLQEWWWWWYESNIIHNICLGTLVYYPSIGCDYYTCHGKHLVDTHQTGEVEDYAPSLLLHLCIHCGNFSWDYADRNWIIFQIDLICHLLHSACSLSLCWLHLIVDHLRVGLEDQKWKQNNQKWYG